MKNIIIFINSMSAPGGIERVVSNLLKIWSNKYRITLLVKDDARASFYEIPENVERVSLNEPLLLDMKDRKQRITAVWSNALKSHNKLKNYLKRKEYDYIYTTTPLNSLEVYLANRNEKDKLVISEHASAFAVNKIYQAIKKFVYPKALCISVPNKMDCEVYESWGCKTIYIPHLFTFSASTKNLLDSKIALNVGRYTADKRQADLIRIWSKIPDKNGWQLWIVGKGEEEDNLRDLINELDVCDSVKLIGHTSTIADIYKQASLFLFSSWMEGFGMVLLEAMAFGIPCISYDCPSGPRDIVIDGYNGYLINNDDQESFQSAVDKVIHMPTDQIRQLGDNAFKTVRKWDNDDIADQWDRLFSIREMRNKQ